jgi:HK97 gp10 family phage protein
MTVEYKSNLRQIAAQIDSEMDLAMADTAEDIRTLAAQLAPKRSGDLSRSGKVTKKGAGHYETSFGDGLTYAVYVEYGTAVSPAQPFLTPAAAAIDPLFRAKERIAALIQRNHS